MPAYPSHSEIEQIHAERKAQVRALSMQPSITASDVQKLTRYGRFQVANELWAKCDATARQSLLHDEHHHVRSAAVLNGDKS